MEDENRITRPEWKVARWKATKKDYDQNGRQPN